MEQTISHLHKEIHCKQVVLEEEILYIEMIAKNLGNTDVFNRVEQDWKNIGVELDDKKLVDCK